LSGRHILAQTILGARSVVVGLFLHDRQHHLSPSRIPFVTNAVSPDKSRNSVLTGPHVDERQSPSLLLLEHLLFLRLFLLAQGTGPRSLFLLVELTSNTLLLFALQTSLFGLGEAWPAVGLPVQLLGLF
jgi:hypothetical protein